MKLTQCKSILLFFLAQNIIAMDVAERRDTPFHYLHDDGFKPILMNCINYVHALACVNTSLNNRINSPQIVTFLINTRLSTTDEWKDLKPKSWGEKKYVWVHNYLGASARLDPNIILDNPYFDVNCPVRGVWEQVFKEEDNTFLKRLIEKKINPNITEILPRLKMGLGGCSVPSILGNIHCYTPFIYALGEHIKEPHNTVLRERFILLKQAGGDIHALNHDGAGVIDECAFLWADDCPDIVQILIEYGAQVNVTDSMGYTPLYRMFKMVQFATTGLSFRVCDGLIFDILYKPWGNQEKHEKGKYIRGYVKAKKLVEDLLKAGADVNIKDIFGRSTYICAKEWGNTEMVKLFDTYDTVKNAKV